MSLQNMQGVQKKTRTYYYCARINIHFQIHKNVK